MSPLVGKIMLMVLGGWAILCLPVVALYVKPTPNPYVWGPIWGWMFVAYIFACVLLS